METWPKSGQRGTPKERGGSGGKHAKSEVLEPRTAGGPIREREAITGGEPFARGTNWYKPGDPSSSIERPIVKHHPSNLGRGDNQTNNP